MSKRGDCSVAPQFYAIGSILCINCLYQHIEVER